MIDAIYLKYFLAKVMTYTPKSRLSFDLVVLICSKKTYIVYIFHAVFAFVMNTNVIYIPYLPGIQLRGILQAVFAFLTLQKYDALRICRTQADSNHTIHVILLLQMILFPLDT